MIVVPQGWDVKRLGEIAKINMGQSPDSDFVNEQREGIAFLQGNAEFGEIHPSEKYWVTEPKKVADAGEILVSVRAPVGEINRADKAYCIGRGLASIKISKLDHEYGFYAFSMAKEQLNRLAQGSTFLAISKDDLDVISILIPPKNEQQKIADILSGIDRAIEATQTLIDKEKMIKKALMADLLNHGIDEQGRIRTPQTHRYIESPLGMIPERWEVGSIRKLVKNLDSKRIPLKETDRKEIEGHYPYYGASGIIDWVNDYIFDGEYVLLGEDGENVVSRVLPLAFKASGKFWVNNHAHIFEPLKGVNIDYVIYLLENTDYKRIINGSAQPKITQEGLGKIKFLIAPIPEQQKIAQILSAQDQKIETEEANLAKLQNLKKALMADLLSGNVRVKG